MSPRNLTVSFLEEAEWPGHSGVTCERSSVCKENGSVFALVKPIPGRMIMGAAYDLLFRGSRLSRLLLSIRQELTR